MVGTRFPKIKRTGGPIASQGPQSALGTALQAMAGVLTVQNAANRSNDVLPATLRASGFVQTSDDPSWRQMRAAVVATQCALARRAKASHRDVLRLLDMDDAETRQRLQTRAAEQLAGHYGDHFDTFTQKDRGQLWHHVTEALWLAYAPAQRVGVYTDERAWLIGTSDAPDQSGLLDRMTILSNPQFETPFAQHGKWPVRKSSLTRSSASGLLIEGSKSLGGMNNYSSFWQAGLFDPQSRKAANDPDLPSLHAHAHYCATEPY